jgi:hypothetical protein
MKVKTQIGSKQRFIEMMERVNGIKLNEDFGTDNNNNSNNNSMMILSQGFKALQNGELNIQGGGSNNTTVQMDDDNSYIEINGVDDNRNNYKFGFKLTYNEGELDNTYNVDSVNLTNFEYRNSDGTQTFKLDENTLNDFNSKYSNELFDVINDYVDVKSPAVQSADLDEAITMIDAIKTDSYPYGGGSERMQTGINYVDQKPTNAKLRVKSPELDKIVEGDYPDALGKEFSPEKNYPKEKKKNKIKKVKLGESTDQEQYENVVFLQGDEAYQPLEILNDKGEDAALEYLKQWHYPGEHEGTDHLGHGSSDHVYEKDGYIMSWNNALGYIGLQYDLSNMDENEEFGKEDDQMSHQSFDDEPEEQNSDDAPIRSIDPYASKMGKPSDDNIEQLEKDKEEAGDMIQGGLADDKSPLEFDPDQILMGMEVEKEHTDNPLIAMEIVMDHLVEDPEYYTEKDNPEDSAQQNAAEDAEGEENNKYDMTNPDNGMESPTDDKEETDILLGYKPKNVGENIEVPNNSTQNDFKKYSDFKKKNFNDLSDEQKEELFKLYQKYKSHK